MTSRIAVRWALRRLGGAVGVAAVAVALAACGSAPIPPGTSTGPGGPSSSTGSGTCPWVAPPRDPTQPTSTCGAGDTDVSVGIGRHADLLPLTVELFVDRERTCVPGGTCVVGDNRDHLSAPTPDPRAAGSRRRATLLLDWANDRADLRVGPRCVLSGPSQTCTSVPAAAVHLALTTVPGAGRPWRFHLELGLPGDPGGAPTPPTTDGWDLGLDPTTGVLTISGDGTGNPDLAMIAGSTVACATPGGPPPGLAASLPVEHVACTVTLAANP